MIDVHSHHADVPPGARLDALVGEMDALNLRVLVNLSGRDGERVSRPAWRRSRRAGIADRMVFFANLDFRRSRRAGLRRARRRTARGRRQGRRRRPEDLQELRLHLQRETGARVATDDPEFDPVWRTCADLGVPVLIHTGEPKAFFDPVDPHNERWLRAAAAPAESPAARSVPDLRRADGRARSALREASEDHVHRGPLRLACERPGAARRDARPLPNTIVETGAILHELGRQPRAAAAFFAKYQDRILFGKDRYDASEYPVLLSSLRDRRRILRLLPRLSRVLEAVRPRDFPTPCCERSTTATLSGSCPTSTRLRA